MMSSPTLGEGPAEQSSGAGHREQRDNAHAASRFTKDRDVVRVASEGCDILLHAFEGRHLVEQTQVGASMPQEEEAVHPQAIVDGDAYHAIAGETAAIIRGYRARPVCERAAMNPDHHRE